MRLRADAGDHACRHSLIAEITRIKARPGSSTALGTIPRSCPPMNTPRIDPAAMTSKNIRLLERGFPALSRSRSALAWVRASTSIAQGNLPLYLFGSVTGKMTAARLAVGAGAPFIFAAVTEYLGLKFALAANIFLSCDHQRTGIHRGCRSVAQNTRLRRHRRPSVNMISLTPNVESLPHRLKRALVDQNLWAYSLRPMDMMCHG